MTNSCSLFFTAMKDGRCVSVFSYLFLIAGCLLDLDLSAQTEIPLDSWRTHISYTRVHSVAAGTTKLFAATENALVVLEKADNSLNTYSKLNGLTTTGITAINYHEASDQVLVAYQDGNIDIIGDDNIINFDRLKNSTTINGSKKINHVSLWGDYAYLAADYGVVVFDLKSKEVKETWRDVGINGGKLRINQSTFQGDTIFLATEKGVLAGNLNDNLLDYNNWKHFDQGVFNGNISCIATLNDKVYAAIAGQGLYAYKAGSWTQASFLQTSTITSLNASVSTLLITENNKLWKLNTPNDLSQVTDGLIQQPLVAIEDIGGSLWIGDAKNGLVLNTSGNFSSYLPNGPAHYSTHKLVYANQTIYSLPGGYSTTFQPLGNDGGLDTFTNGRWENKATATIDLTDISITGSTGNYFISSFGYGLEERTDDALIQVFDETNSPLVNLNPPGRFVNVTAIENSLDGLWVTNYGALSSLHLFKGSNVWESFSFPAIAGSRYPTALAVDANKFVWMVLNPSQGGGIIVFDKQTNKTKYITDQAGSGALPSKAVLSIAIDRDGYVWIGTESGVAYFTDPYYIFSTTTDAVKPILENRFLLRNEKVTAIKIDGANRKWVGTDKGVWLFNATGDNYIYNFTAENSPLLSNTIRDIEINPISGEVFFVTDKGIISYRSTATQSNDAFQNIKIFPNPVTHDFAGTIGISGLATDAVVKITDISGNLVWQTQANGGTASWNAQDAKGRRVATGIYLVFAATQDGAESAVGKIAVIE
jgi:ligand-binding sensor domain-containing protein